jgi:hypothetical protein
MHTVRSYMHNGYYFSPTQCIYQAARLKDIISHVRQCMEDGEHQIGIFDSDGKCKGFWNDEAEPISDGEGGMVLEKPSYVLYRPGDMPAGIWNVHLSKFKRA